MRPSNDAMPSYRTPNSRERQSIPCQMKEEKKSRQFKQPSERISDFNLIPMTRPTL